MSSAAEEEPHGLPLRPLLCYCHFFFAVSAFYGIYQTVRGYVYRDTLKMRLGTLSWILVAVKGFDLVSGAVISRWSDRMWTKWGRRKPFITIAWPIAMVVMVLQAAAGLVLRKDQPDLPCASLVNSSASSSGYCPALRECILANQANGTLPANNASKTIIETYLNADVNETAVAVWFFFAYGFYFFFFISSTVLVYDALGQELTTNYSRRGLLFMSKSLFGMIGGIFGVQLLTTFVGMNKTDTALASFQCSVVLAIYGLFAWALLLFNVKERKVAENDKTCTDETPFVVTFLRMLRNRPYMYYLMMKVPMTFLGQLPYQLVMLLFQNNMSLESLQDPLGTTQIIAIVGALFSVPLQRFCDGKFGRKNTLTGFLGVLGSLFILATFLPYESSPSIMYFIGPFLGACLTLPNVLPDAILGDLILYDELLTGVRAEAMYTMVETNMQQGIELVLALAQLIMALAGWQPLGDCECGCGVSCDRLGMPHARWVCPDSVGYACYNQDVGSTLLFVPEPSVVPCTVQNDAVRGITATFMFFIPGVCGLLAIPPIRKAIIVPEQLTKILAGIAALKADPSAVVEDPVRGGVVRRPDGKEGSLFREHFTSWEWLEVAKSGASAGLSSLRMYVGGRLAAYGVLVVALIVANVAVIAGSTRSASETLLQLTFLTFALLLVATPLDTLRYGALQRKLSGPTTFTSPPDGTETTAAQPMMPANDGDRIEIDASGSFSRALEKDGL